MSAEAPAPPVVVRGTWPKAVPLLVLAGLLAYCNSFNKALIFDDVAWIVGHPDIGDFARYMSEWSRPVVRLSIQLNYKLGGLNPAGYHALNLGVHVLAALTLFGLVRRVVRLPRFAGRYDDHADYLAFAVALLWLVHPLQTQSVTYIIQRCESMMGLFYLFALYAWTRAATGGARAWYAAAVGSFALSAGCKEVAATLPPVLVAFDRVFLAASWREVRGRWPAYLAVLAVWGGVLFPYARIAFGGGTSAGIGFGLNTATPWTYLLTQSEVILHYLRLSVWPTKQAIDYLDWPIAQSLREVWPAFLAVVALLLVSLVLLYRRPAVGFVAFWFFALLAPTSSVMPIIDPAFEHRMYLSLAAVVIGGVFGAHAVLTARDWPDRKRAVFGFGTLAAAALMLTSLTYARNETYRTQLSALEHAVAARPNNPRNFVSLAAVYLNVGELGRADAAIRKAEPLPGALDLPARQQAPLYALRGNFAESEALYRTLLSRPFHPYISPLMYKNLTWVRIAMGKPDLAVATMRILVDQQPHAADNQLVLAAAELAAGREPEARAAAAEAVRLDPSLPKRAAVEARGLVFAPESSAAPLFKPRALWQAAAACLADGDRDPMMLDTLALAYAANGRFADAAGAARRGIAAAEAKGDTDWVLALKARLKLYEAGKASGNGNN